jgi:F0F1-type ATP synthase assembly protein I
MKTLLHFKRHEDRYFHTHPLHLTFSLIAAFVLAVLIVFVLAVPAH